MLVAAVLTYDASVAGFARNREDGKMAAVERAANADSEAGTELKSRLALNSGKAAP